MTYGGSGAHTTFMTYTDTDTDSWHGSGLEMDFDTRVDASQLLLSISDLQRTNDGLLANLARRNEDIIDLRRRMAALEADHDNRIEEITDALHEKANKKGFCDEFDDFMEEIGLRRRTREYEVTITATITCTLTVEAADEDDANDKALEEIDLGGYLARKGFCFDILGSPEVEVTG